MGLRLAFCRSMVLILAFAAGGCATSAGEPAKGFLTPAIARAYLPLEGTAYLVLEAHGAAVVIAPGIAATDAHNANLVDSGWVIGVSTDYDLLFFRTERQDAPPQGEPQAGESVIAYGQGTGGELRMAGGTVRWTDAPVLPRCAGCGMQHAFAFEAGAGKGFSGGPVVDARDGRLVGIVFGFKDDAGQSHARLMYAYGMRRVFAELDAVRKKAPEAEH